MLDRLAGGFQELVILAGFFTLASLVVRGPRALVDWKAARAEWRTNLIYFITDLVLMVPVLTLMSQGIVAFMAGAGIAGMASDHIAKLPAWVTVLLIVAVSDLVGYWRHRLMHLPALWPVHAAHHSDRHVGWLTLIRFHPINRLVAVGLNAVVLTALGFPVWAVVIDGWVRHFYGYYVHANLGWRYGPLRYVFVSPHLHRWHHARDREAIDKNFATVFAFYDLLFGTFYSPAAPAENLGVTETDYPAAWWGQILYPFRIWARQRTAPRTAPKPAE
ncbi:MAG: fatty acid hydroxylase family protein [Alphaproteobacteria bacterium]|nr:MAG: fatty acid hydroxylase family protein [Alphaproteobacteria bacterium]